MGTNETVGIATQSRVWTPARTKQIGLAGLIGGLAFAAFVLVLNVLNAWDVLVIGSLESWSVWSVHAIAYVLMVAVLFAADARYGIGYGWLGRAAVYLLGVLFLVLAAFGLVTEALPNWDPGFTTLDLSFLGVHLVATFVGVVLWRYTTVSRLAAGLFIATAPMVVVAMALDLYLGINLTTAGFEVPLIVGFAALGYDLWSDSDDTSHDVDTVVA